MSTPDFAMPKPEMASPSQDPKELEAVKSHLFSSTMKRNWDEVIEAYKTKPMARRAQITKLKDTALHVAVSTGRGEIALKLLDVIYDNMEGFIVEKVVNTEGNTPLHLAAAQAELQVCKKIVSMSNPQVLTIRNNKGETPLFLAASRGKEKTFFFLHSHFPQEQLLRRSHDGNTVLHMAISRDYFRMALKIIKDHPGLADSLNENGESPLHLLANKPNAFRRSTTLGLYDTIIYHCQVVDIGIETQETSPLKKNNGEIFQEEEEDNENKNSSKNHPENYDTCMIFIRTLRNFFLTFGRSLFGDDKKDDNKSDAEKQSGSNEGKVVRGKKFFPSNYDSWILFLKFIMKALLVVLGFGISRINKIKKMKQQHIRAKRIMNELVKHSSYADGSDPQWTGASETTMQMTGTPTLYDPTGTSDMTPYQVGISDIAQIKKLPNPTGTSKMIPFQVDIPQIEKISDLTKTSEMTFYEVAIGQIKKQSPTGSDPTGTSEMTSFQVGVSDIAQIKKLSDPAGTSEMTPYQVGISYIPQIEKLSDPTGTSEMTFYKVGIAQTVKQSPNILPSTPTPILIAAKAGVVEIVEKILDDFPVAIQDVDSKMKNVVLLAVENRQPDVYNLLVKLSEKKVFPKENVFSQVDENGNTALHLAANQSDEHRPWLIPGSALQMQWEIKWYKFVKNSMPQNFFSMYNKNKETAEHIFIKTHKELIKDGSEWLSKTSESCSVVAALVAAMAFTTYSAVPGGVKEEIGIPTLEEKPAFNAFAISSLIALCFSVTALVFFLSILTSRYQEKDFANDLPRKLLLGLTSLFASIASMLVSFCSGHIFILNKEFKYVAYPLYAALCLPVTFFAFAQLSLYFDLLRAIFSKVPRRNYKVFQH